MNIALQTDPPAPFTAEDIGKLAALSLLLCLGSGLLFSRLGRRQDPNSACLDAIRINTLTTRTPTARHLPVH